MKLLVILTTFTACLDLISAKSSTSINQEAKTKASSKLNSLSTTPKPDQYSVLQQQQQYRQQNYPQQPLPALYQIQSQPQRQLHGPPQQIIYQQAQVQQQPQLSQAQLQQVQLQHAQLQQAQQQPQISHAQLQQAQLQRAQQQPQISHAQLQQAQLQRAQLQQEQLQQAHLQQQAAYQAQLHAQLQPQIQQLIQKAYLVPQQQNRPAAMILIAQPAYVPQNVAYGGAGQQYVHYVQANPQARYLQSSNQGQLQHIPQQTPANTIGYHQVVAVPTHYQQNVVAVPQATHLTQTVPVAVQAPAAQSVASQAQPSPLQLAHIAQIASQQYSRINPAPTQQQTASTSPYSYQSEPRVVQQDLQAGLPVGSIPPIITGFENFTPEQQEKIKAQLSQYFGAPLKPLPNSGVPSNLVQDAQGQGKSQYVQRYQEERPKLSEKEFVPSEQVKEDASASSSNVFKSHYARA